MLAVDGKRRLREAALRRGATEKPPKSHAPRIRRPQGGKIQTRHALLAQEARDIILVVGRDGRILEANRAASTTYGYSPKELLALTIHDLRAPETHSLTARQMARADAAGILFETMHRRKDGSAFPVEVSSRGIQWGRRRVLLSIVRDITERVEAQQALRLSEARFGAAFRASPDGIAITTLADGRVIEVNESGLRLLGYARDEVIGRTVEELRIWIHPEDRARLFVPPLQDHGAVRGLEVELRPKVGKPVVVLASAETLDIGGEHCLLTVLHDITKRKRAEKALRKREAALRAAHAELEQRVRERTADLSHMVETLAAEVGRRLQVEEELRALAAHLESVREEERTAVAKEVHDVLGQGLAAVKLSLAGLAQLSPDEPAWQVEAKAITVLLEDLMRAALRLFEELHPSALELLGLGAALTEESRAFQGWSGITCQVTTDMGDLRLNPVQATVFFRLCQEWLSLVARHAHATRVAIHLHEEAEHLIMKITDDGRGITAQGSSSSVACGVTRLKERTRCLGGEFTISEEPSAGTTVTVSLPIT